ncbi:winged helix-turn-helix domain-containing protein [Kibdelosporangium philippinense]|uniref:Winged helix-turn-helix domain-containing protein n=1 Tax=Kibdelosporangium philippinense TaxID=211113 RepID=A0ABS8ZR09_9PSEU|nr:BTAD domain-containing putative transcriptional regulator [Kibdelosporangium philippinense]MCE7008898.1 winged helix-turn-helix domain-containing protein [Kibdelosporangium philippinense]
MRFGVLGPLTVHTSHGEPVTVTRTAVRLLLADLLVHAGEPVSADRLIEDIWGVQPPRDPMAALQVRVAQLRSALGDRTLVESTPAGYRLLAQDTDAAEFVALTRQAAADPVHRAAKLEQALALWRGPAYADFADNAFAQPAITRLTEQRLTAIEDRLDALETWDLGELAELVATHPLRERLRAVHMRALYQAGRQSEALASFRELAASLRDELGIDPGTAIVELHQRILRQDTGLTKARTNLPATEPLIGRAAATAEVNALLESQRLVTLTGSGGVGKTRLALATAGNVTLPDGVWLVELAAASSVTEAILTTLGVREYQELTPTDLVLTALRDKQMLLVLDNCEHVVAEAADLVSRLLRTAPSVRVLTTSQEPLGLPAEIRYPVPPLDSADAVALLRERVKALGHQLSDDPLVIELCKRLDGIPLALELAASRVPALGIAELVARLDDRFKVLTSGYRDAPPRQRTLRAILDWSWGLLSPQEQLVLRRLSVHVEGCTLAAAEAVSGLDVLDELTTLVQRSLVVVTHNPVPRYRLLESVAQYSLERLAESGEEPETRQRHQIWYLQLAEEARDNLYGPGQQHWITTLDRESANLRAALDSMIRTGAADPALRLANALTGYWFLRGRRAESTRALNSALALGGSRALRAQSKIWQLGLDILAGQRTDRVAACEAALQDFEGDGLHRAEWFLGYALFTAGELTASEDLIARALAGFKDDPWGEAVALGVRADQASVRGDLSTVEQAGTRAARMLAEIGDKWGQSQVVTPLASLAEITGDYERAEQLHTEGLRLAEELGLWTDVAERLTGLGRLRLLAGDYRGAWDLHERAMHLAAEHSYEPGVVHAELGLALGARREGKLDIAEKHFKNVLEWQRDADYTPGDALIFAELGFIAELQGDVAKAVEIQHKSLYAAQSVGDPRAIALALEGLAGAHALDGSYSRAAELLAKAASMRAAAGAPLPKAERLDVDRITEAIRRGQASES